MEKLDYGKFGKYGAVGVILALISLLGLAMWINYKTAGNHINHSNDILRELNGTILQNTEVMRAVLKELR